MLCTCLPAPSALPHWESSVALSNSHTEGEDIVSRRSRWGWALESCGWRRELNTLLMILLCMIFQIWGSSSRVQAENIFMKELEGERRHSWSNSSVLDNWDEKLKVCASTVSQWSFSSSWPLLFHGKQSRHFRHCHRWDLLNCEEWWQGWGAQDYLP